jgi:hypothetical protein
VPGWLEYLSIWSILIITAYVLAFALLESICLLGLVVFLSLFFPPRFFKEIYILQGSSLALFWCTGAWLIQRKITLIYRLELWQLAVYPLVVLLSSIVLVFLMAFMFRRFLFLSRLGKMVVERMVIFVYIYVPLGALGLLVVLLRNMIGF